MSEKERCGAWECKIGALGIARVPLGGDSPMREAVAQAFEQLTGQQAEFTFSGWGSQLTELERAVVENRDPSEDYAEGFRTGRELIRLINGGTIRSRSFHEGVAAAFMAQTRGEL